MKKKVSFVFLRGGGWKGCGYFFDCFNLAWMDKGFMVSHTLKRAWTMLVPKRKTRCFETYSQVPIVFFRRSAPKNGCLVLESSQKMMKNIDVFF